MIISKVQAQEFLCRLQEYMREKGFTYMLKEVQGDVRDDWDYIHFDFGPTGRRFYRMLVLPEFKFIARMTGTKYWYSSAPRMKNGYTRQPRAVIVVPEDYYVPVIVDPNLDEEFILDREFPKLEGAWIKMEEIAL